MGFLKNVELEPVLSMFMAAAGRAGSRLTALILLTVLTVSLGGCAGGSLGGVFSGSGNHSASSNLAAISFAPVIGPPADVGSKLTGQLVAAAQQQNIPVITDKSKAATYTVQGFLAQSNEKKKEKFSYIWDVRDKSGNRVHRILGEEAVPAKPGAKPWTSINQAALQKIATRTASDLAVWLPKQGGAAGAGAVATPAAARSTPAAQRPHTSTSARTASAGTQKKRIAVLIPPVSGAPGDGRKSLTNAIKSQLRAKGIQVASTGGTNVYKVNGKVTMGNGKTAATQSVKIDWQLLSATGRDLGSVTQQTDVPKGSLNRSWGPAALSAGNAAASEIVKLIAKSRG